MGASSSPAPPEVPPSSASAPGPVPASAPSARPCCRGGPRELQLCQETRSKLRITILSIKAPSVCIYTHSHRAQDHPLSGQQRIPASAPVSRPACPRHPELQAPTPNFVRISFVLSRSGPHSGPCTQTGSNNFKPRREESESFLSLPEVPVFFGWDHPSPATLKLPNRKGGGASRMLSEYRSRPEQPSARDTHLPELQGFTSAQGRNRPGDATTGEVLTHGNQNPQHSQRPALQFSSPTPPRTEVWGIPTGYPFPALRHLQNTHWAPDSHTLIVFSPQNGAGCLLRCAWAPLAQRPSFSHCTLPSWGYV